MSLCTLLAAKEEGRHRGISFSSRWWWVRCLLVHTNHCPLIILIGFSVGRAKEWKAGVAAHYTTFLGSGTSCSGAAGGFEKSSIQVLVRLLLRRGCTCCEISLSTQIFDS